MNESQTLKDLKILYQNKLFHLELSIKYLGITQSEIDKILDQLNELKSEIEQIENQK